MKQSTIRSLSTYVLLLIGTAHSAQGTTSINCPGIAYLGDSAHITCTTSVPFTTLQYSRPIGGVFPQCSGSLSRCAPVAGYYASKTNNTHTDFKILSVQRTHAGSWTCADAGSNSKESCDLSITNVPRCNIRSDKITDTLALSEDLALTVDIHEYYCSAQYSFTLLVGEINVQLQVSESVNKPTNKTVTTTLNVTASSLGGVQLLFLCYNEQQIFSCDGIKFINVLPRCIITSGKTSNAVKLHEELDLTVDIQDYFCSASYNITLQVGDVSHALSTSQIGTRLTNMSVNTTLNLTDSYFGDVRLIFFCNDQQQVLTCQGLQSIKDINVPTTFPTKSTASTSTPSTSTPSRSTMSYTRIVAAVVSFIVIVVVSLTAVGCCYRHRVKQSHQTHTSDNQSDLPNEAVENPAYNKSTFNENILY
ncbi:uncharacterized protein LOC124149690 [Haliotis rufescens]|uniref:uncharacterized protein LOC124149690 n=1 Tax=Haliotis rufescens TaxID=6454 RepID=UPI00201ED865|nr:uncharacterized protein LOC124149690 [Haliotis rufescens]